MRSLIVLALVAAGCAPPSPPASHAFRIAVPGTLGPVTPDSSNGYSAIAQDWVFLSLVRLGRDGELTPLLAKSIRRADARTLELRLSDDAAFSDGSRVAAIDVLDSLKAAGLVATERGGTYLVHSGDDGLPIEFRLAEAPIFRSAGQGLVGTGPFLVASQDAAHILLRRRQPRPDRINEVLFSAYPTPRDAFAHTLAGDAELLPTLDPREVEFFDGVPRLRVLRSPAIHSFAVAFNRTRQSAGTRRELVASLAREEISGTAFAGACAPIPGRTPHERRPLPPGPRLNLQASLGMERAALAIRRSLGERGGEIEILDNQAHVKSLVAGSYDLSLMNLLVPVPGMAITNWHTRSPLNFGYSNPRVDAALEAGDLPRAAKELDEDPPVDFICQEERIAVIDSRIKNARLGPFGLLETLPDWEVSP